MKKERKIAFHFILLLGIVSLFADITYEGARSVIGPYLAILGASASVVGIISGIGEFLGYSLRLPFGYLADYTKKYWLITFLGYGLILSVPLLAFANRWEIAAFLIILERIGKVRGPARDAILSYATKKVGRGFGFGIHEALDQLGALIGPLIFSILFFLNWSYREAFTILWIPAFLTLFVLGFARTKIPSPQKFEKRKVKRKTKLPKAFWYYSLFIFLSVAGFVNFQIISYHFKTLKLISDVQIPLFYSIAMAVDAVVALLVGKIYDRIGFSLLILIPFLTMLIPFFTFSFIPLLLLVGIILWGATMGIHETIMRAAIADLTPINRRGFAYGIFNTLYGISWLFGSSLIGLMYEISIDYIGTFVIGMEVLSVIVFILIKKSLH